AGPSSGRRGRAARCVHVAARHRLVRGEPERLLGDHRGQFGRTGSREHGGARRSRTAEPRGARRDQGCRQGTGRGPLASLRCADAPRRRYLESPRADPMLVLLLLHAITGAAALVGGRRLGRRSLVPAAIAPALTFAWAVSVAPRVLDG